MSKPKVIANAFIILRGPTVSEILRKYNIEDENAAKRINSLSGRYPINFRGEILHGCKPVPDLPEIDAVVKTDDPETIYYTTGIKKQAMTSLASPHHGYFTMPYNPFVTACSENDYPELSIKKGDILRFKFKNNL
jgi:hypothetical protein